MITPKRPRDPNQLAKSIIDSPPNAFSKNVENHAYAVALHMMYYNFVRIHQKLRVTPAMAAGTTDKLWDIGDIAKLVEDMEKPAGKRGVV